MAYVASIHTTSHREIRKVGHFPSQNSRRTSSTLERKKNKTEEAEAKRK